MPHYEKRSSPATTITVPPPPMYTQSFFSRELAGARAVYLKILVGGCFLISITLFAIFSIYWGSLWKTPLHNLHGWIVDYDNSLIGMAVTKTLEMPSSMSKMTWTVVPTDLFPRGTLDVERAVREEHTWAVLIVNPDSTARLNASYVNPDRAYNGSRAITVYAAEARNENAFRTMIRTSVQAQLGAAGAHFAQEAVKQLLASSADGAVNITDILATSPQTILAPLNFTMVNLSPFDHPVATAVTFVGLIYQLILSFFVVMASLGAREASGFNKSLSLRSLVIVRLASAFVAYFFIALFYTLLSVAFQLDFTRRFGHAGIVIFWMLNWVGMLSVGLALEALITVLTTRFIPFFLITWIIVNVSVAMFPIEVMPVVFRYGYAAPFYNVSRAVRTIVFATKNDVGKNFGILIAWMVVSCITLPFLQWIARRQDIKAARAQDVGVNRGNDGGAVLDVSAGGGKGEGPGVMKGGVYTAAGTVKNASGDLGLHGRYPKLGLPGGDMDGGMNGVEEGVVLISSRSRSMSGSVRRSEGV